jgi:arylsulfatase A-like enzyme
MPPNRREVLSILGLGAAALTLPSLPWPSAAYAAEPSQKLNFIFILVDDMGWKDLSSYGNTWHETPSIDKLAAQGMRFTQAYAACPVCSPTRASILTGKYPARLGITNFGKVPLPKTEVTLAQALRDAGYKTGYIGKWHLGEKGHWPTEAGFDINLGGSEQGQPPSYFSPYRLKTLPDGPHGEYLTDRLTTEANKYIAENKDRPFLLYLSHYAPHTPLQAKKELIQKYVDKPGAPPRGKDLWFETYAAMVASIDQSVDAVMKQLDDLKIADRTVVIFTSDNGGYSDPSNRPLKARKGALHEGGIRVPLIVRWPGAVKPGTTCETPVTSPDFYPTFLDIAGLPPRPKQHVDGISILPLLKQTGQPDRDTLHWHYPHKHGAGGKFSNGAALRKGDVKLIEFFEDGRLELYNLKDDPYEKKNLAAEMPQKVQDLHNLMKAWRKEVNAKVPAPTTAPSIEE